VYGIEFEALSVNIDMKKLMIMVALFLTTMGQTNAQSDIAKSVEPGIKGGLNFSTLNKDLDDNAKTRTSFHLGLFTHIHLNHHFALQPELLFSAQGANYNGDRIDKLNYFNVPILVQYMFDNGFRLETGPQVGLLASAKTHVGDMETNIKDGFTSADLAWAFGIGFLSKGGFGVDARYNLGLTDISKNESGIKNNVFQLGVFYQFRKMK
jgi:Outer membrane protein beta-barrel domain